MSLQLPSENNEFRGLHLMTGGPFSGGLLQGPHQGRNVVSSFPSLKGKGSL